VPWLPADWAVTRDLRPDGVLVLTYPDGAEERVAVEVDLTQHSARVLAAKVAAYLEAFARGYYHLVRWYCVPGGTATAPERALADYGTGDARMAVRPIPAGATVYE
jgi:hypothetical protein